MKNSLDGFKNRMEMTEERISEVEDKSLEIIQSKEQTKKKLRKKLNRISGICGIRTKALTFIPAEEEKKCAENKVNEKFPNLAKDINLQIQEV